MPTPNHRRRLTELAEELRQAREELETLLAAEQEQTSDPFQASRNLRRAFRNAIALDEMKHRRRVAGDRPPPGYPLPPPRSRFLGVAGLQPRLPRSSPK